MIVQRRGPAYRFQAQGTQWAPASYVSPWRGQFWPMLGFALGCAATLFALALLLSALDPAASSGIGDPDAQPASVAEADAGRGARP